MLMKVKSKIEAALNSCFIVAAEIAKSALHFNEREWVKKCTIKVCDVVCPDKKQDFLNVSLSRNTVAKRV